MSVGVIINTNDMMTITNNGKALSNSKSSFHFFGGGGNVIGVPAQTF